MGVAPYASFKGGLEVLTRYIAKESSSRRIRANSVAPRAHPHKHDNQTPDRNSTWVKALAEQTALGRIGEPEDLARLVVNLLSQDSGWINAQNIEAGGGYNI